MWQPESAPDKGLTEVGYGQIHEVDARRRIRKGGTLMGVERLALFCHVNRQSCWAVLAQENSRRMTATAQALGDVVKKLYMRILALEQQLKHAGLDPALPDQARITHIGGIAMEDLEVEHVAPTATLHRVFTGVGCEACLCHANAQFLPTR
jgi:hypothetical protein